MTSIIPLCVPPWDSREALNNGAQYSNDLGYYVPAEAYLDDVWMWLPLRWRFPHQAALLPEMLPSSSWEDNLRYALTSKQWDVLRKYCYRAGGHRCEICGDAGRLECHEKWTFDDVWCEQRLTGLISLCPLCHKAHHLGIARRLGVLSDVYAKMRDVNNWSKSDLDCAIAHAKSVADERNKFAWHVDLSWLTEGSYNLLYRLDG